MANDLSSVILKIGEDYKADILKGSACYLEVEIDRTAAELGLADLTRRYKDVRAIVPLKRPRRGMKVRIDGRTFVNYSQFESGVVVPRYVAEAADLPHQAYVAREDMICNYT